MEIINVLLSKIKFDKNQPRKTIDHDKVKGMALSIKTEGLINPVEIDRTYTVITGEMRTRAARLAGLKTIPCKVMDLSPDGRFRRQVIENIHNLTMTAYDTAKAIQKLLMAPGATVQQLSKEIGIPRRTMRDYLDIFKASQPIQKAIQTGNVPYTFIRILNAAPEEFKAEIQDQILANKFAIREIGLQVVNALKKYPEKAKEILSSKDIKELNKIAPTQTQIVGDKLGRVNELNDIKDKLLLWLDSNPPASLYKVSLPMVSFALGTIMGRVIKYNQPTKQLN